MNKNDLWIYKTNQSWKILIFILMIFLGGLLLMGTIMVANETWRPSKISGFELAVSSIIVGFGALAWFTQAIKCPKCGHKPVWPILKSSPASEWLGRITKLENCPFCKE